MLAILPLQIYYHNDFIEEQDNETTSSGPGWK